MVDKSAVCRRNNVVQVSKERRFRGHWACERMLRSIVKGFELLAVVSISKQSMFVVRLSVLQSPAARRRAERWWHTAASEAAGLRFGQG